MWDCIKCGCRKIAHGLSRCPVCKEEKDMPKASLGGPSNVNALPGETGYIPLEEPAADAPVAAEVTPAAVAVAVEMPVPAVAGQAVSEPDAEPKAAPVKAAPKPAPPAKDAGA